ncbi:hypothetical protein [Chromobacterium haemolyticum]|uniref:hypothetical protein n=1 Tax=Chromobacterium haemolyticum TaxID=394935 RepID=UPI00193BAF66
MWDRVVVGTLAIALCSGTGIAVILSAIFLSIQESFHQAKLVAVCSIVGQVLSLALASHLGRLADSCRNTHYLRIAYAIGIATAASAALLSYFRIGNQLFLYALIVTASTMTLIRILDQSTRGAILHVRLHEEKYLDATRYLELVRQGITFLSGGIAMLVIRNDSVYWACLFCIACLLVSIACSFRLDGPETNHQSTQQQKISLRHIIQKHVLHNENRALMLLTLLPYAMVLALNSLYPKIFTSLSHNPVYYSALVIPYGLGAIIGSALKPRQERFNLAAHAIRLTGAFAISLAVFAITRHHAVLYACIFSFAFCHASIRVQRNYQLMLLTEKGILGSVSGFYEMIALALAISLALLSTAIADRAGVLYSIGSLGAVMLLTCALIAASQIKKPLSSISSTARS